MELKDYLRVIRRRWGWFAFVMALFALIFGTFLVREEPQYQATARVLVRLEAAEPYISNPLMRPQMPGLTTATREAILTTEQVLKDATIIYAAQVAIDRKLIDPSTEAVKKLFADAKVEMEKSPLVKKTGLALDLLDLVKGAPIVPGRPSQGTFGDLFFVDHDVRHANTAASAFHRINDRLAAVRVAKVNDKLQFVNVSFQGPDPREAVLLVNAVAFAGMDWSENDTKSSVAETIANNKKKGDALADEMQGLSAEVARVDELESKRTVTQARLASLEQRLDQLGSEKRRFEKMKASHREGEHRDGMGLPREEYRGGNDEVRAIQAKIHALEQEREGRLLVHTPENRDIKQMDAQLLVLQKQLKAAETQAESDWREYVAAQIEYYEEEITDTGTQIEAVKTELGSLSSQIDPLLSKRARLDYLKSQLDNVTRITQELDTLLHGLNGFIKVEDAAEVALEQPKSMESKWAFWMLMSIVVGLGICYFREYLDTSIMTEYDVRRHLNLPVLGLIPELTTLREGRALFDEGLVRAPLSEMFNTIGTLVRTAMNQEAWKTILVVSANPAEGKTFVSIHLALSLARKGLKVVLIDSDMRKPQIHATLGLENTVGLSTLLAPVAEGAEAAPGSTLETILQRTELPNLQVITSGPVPQNPVQLLESNRMRDLLLQLREQADFVIFDTPPICSVGDSIALATIVDVVLYVVGARYSEQQDATWAKHLLTNVQANLLGVVMNHMEARRSREYYYYYTRERKNVREGS